MRLLLWAILLFGGYVWLKTSGNEEAALSQGKKIYQSLLGWFDDAELEFHFKKEAQKKKSRRWD